MQLVNPTLAFLFSKKNQQPDPLTCSIRRIPTRIIRLTFQKLIILSKQLQPLYNYRMENKTSELLTMLVKCDFIVT